MTTRQFIDLTKGTGGDSGFDEPEAIQPCLNGENVDAADPGVGYGGIINRPAENLRQRTEAIRTALNELLYLRDADRGLMLGGPGRVTWPGSTTAAASGIPVLDDTLYVIPALTPGSEQTAPIPPVTSKFGTLTLQRTGPAAGIVVTSARRSYLGGDQISVKVVSGGALSAVLADPEERTILLTVTNSTTLLQAITALNNITASPAAAALVTCALAAGASNSDTLVTTQAKQFVAGNVDGEGHAITPANLASFFTSNPTSALAEGDTLGIWFDEVVESGGTGGRRQAIPENSNTAVPAASFFNSRISPSKVPNGIPICKVIGGRLVFLSGTQIPAGVTNYSFVGTNASSTTYAGGAAWLDGTANPAATVEAQLDKLITDLIATTLNASGADRIGIDAKVYGFASQSAESVKARINAIEVAKANTGFTNTFTATQIIDAPDETEAAGFAIKTADLPVVRYKPIAKFPSSSGKFVRVFVSGDVGGEFIVTVNAKWDPAGPTWSRDAAGNSTYISLSLAGISMQYRVDTAVAWAYNAWTNAPLLLNADGTTFIYTGDLQINGDITGATVETDEPDVRHGNRTIVTKVGFPFDDSDWKFGISASEHKWSIPTATAGSMVLPLPLAAGDRIKSVHVMVKSAGGAAADIVGTLQEIIVAPTATYTVNNVGPTPQGNLANTNIQSMDLSPASPYVAIEASYQVLISVPGTTSGLKHVYQITLVYDRP